MYWGLFAKRLFVLCVGFIVINGKEVHKEEKGSKGMINVKGEENENGSPRVYVQVEEDESGSSSSNSNDSVGVSYGYDKVEERKEEKYKNKNKSLRGVKGNSGKGKEDDNGLDEDGDVKIYGNNKYNNQGYGGNKRVAKSIKKSRFSTNKYL